MRQSTVKSPGFRYAALSRQHGVRVSTTTRRVAGTGGDEQDGAGTGKGGATRRYGNENPTVSLQRELVSKKDGFSTVPGAVIVHGAPAARSSRAATRFSSDGCVEKSSIRVFPESAGMMKKAFAPSTSRFFSAGM